VSRKEHRRDADSARCERPETARTEATDADEGTLRLHATVVAAIPDTGEAPRGLIILGRSGAGKSALALQLMALGAVLVADDQTCLARRGAVMMASCPSTIRGMIEARGVGLLAARTLPSAELALAVDLNLHESARMPPLRRWTALGIDIPLLHSVESNHFPAALMQYLLQGRSDRE